VKRVLLTGASGFIGRYCIPALISRGYDVHATFLKENIKNENGISWHQADLLDVKQVDTLINDVQPSHLLHLAWNVEPPGYWKSVENIRWLQASLTLLQAFRRAGGKRVVAAGSCTEYEWRDGIYQEEATPLLPATLYGRCKHSLGMVLESYAKEAGISAAWGRIFFLYGPHEHPSRLVPVVINALLNKQEALCSSGEQVRDFLYVEDIADAFVSLLESEVQGAVNIASGQPTAVKEIVCEIARQLGRSNLIRLGALPQREGDPNFLVADVKMLKEEVGWVPNTGLVNGIKKTIEWWKKAQTFEIDY
jgi:nucleoside-diphosphate-sugar epimerase